MDDLSKPEANMAAKTPHSSLQLIQGENLAMPRDIRFALSLHYSLIVL